MADVTGTLEGWYVEPHFPGLVFGEIHGDAKDRFADGTPIRTSLVKSISTPGYEQGTIVYTLNSTYLLGVPRATAAAE